MHLKKTFNSLIGTFSLVESFSKENLFTVNNVEVQGVLDLNFNREKYINKAFINSFKVLMKKILLTRDLNKVNNIKLKDVKNFVDSFQILEENYNQDEYKLKIKILYNIITTCYNITTKLK